MDRKVFFDKVRALVFRRMDQGQVKGMTAILSYWETTKLTDLRYLAYMLATTYHETAHTMQPISERGRVSYFNKYEPGTKIGKNLGNTKKGDGYRYRGRGYVQLTGRSNYTKMTKLLGVDLVNNPDLALDHTIAAKIMFEGMLAAKSYRGDFTGKKLEDYFTESKSDWINARRIINGTDRASLIAGYARKFFTALVAADIQLKSPEALQPQRSRTIQASSAVGLIGGGTVAASAADIGNTLFSTLDSVDQANYRFSSGDIFGMVMGTVLLGLAIYIAYVRWDDAGRPTLRQIFGKHEEAKTLDQEIEG